MKNIVPELSLGTLNLRNKFNWLLATCMSINDLSVLNVYQNFPFRNYRFSIIFSVHFRYMRRVMKQVSYWIFLKNCVLESRWLYILLTFSWIFFRNFSKKVFWKPVGIKLLTLILFSQYPVPITPFLSTHLTF